MEHLNPAAEEPPQEKMLVLANPRMRRTGSITDPLKAALPATCTVLAVDGPAAMADRARRAAAEGYSRVIVAGGDGTVGVVVRALLKSEMALGIIPMGTCNNFARSLGIPLDVRAACELAVTGQPRPIDLGRVESKDPQSSFVFKEMVGVGVDAEAFAIAAARPERSKVLSVATSVLRALLGFRVRPLRYTTDQQPQPVACTQLLIANTSTYGPAVQAVPGARPDDQIFHLRSMTWRSRADLMHELPALLQGGGLSVDELSRPLSEATARSLHITGSRSVLLHADGEFFCRLPARIEILPGALQVVTPAV